MNEPRSPQRVKARTKGVTGYASVMRNRTGLGRFGNPFDFKEHGRQWAVEQFARWIVETPEGQATAALAKIELRGRDLGCTCPLDGPCHGDVLLRVANEITDA